MGKFMNREMQGRLAEVVIQEKTERLIIGYMHDPREFVFLL